MSLIQPPYSYLADLLAMGKWQEADQETAEVMLQVVDKAGTGWLDRQSIENFPCHELQTIDQLWIKYSNGRFGLSVQTKILSEGGVKYQEYNQEYNYQTLCKLGDRLGWRKGWWDREWKELNQLTFDLTAPKGHLPLIWFWWDIVGDLKVWNISLQLIYRMKQCQSGKY